MMKKNIALLILAAGSSSRMGKSKQLLLLEGEPLLKRSVRAAMSSQAHSVTVALGDRADAHAGILRDLPIHVLVNQDWEKGMGSTLKGGLLEIVRTDPSTDALLVMVCDQPEVTSKHLDSLIHQYHSGSKPIVASTYKNVQGVPAIFDRSLFEELLRVKDTEGAKAVIAAQSESVLSVPMPGGEIDLDTPEDYNAYVSGQQ
jgi:molybdenum cofactor cytidylyltransferase